METVKVRLTGVSYLIQNRDDLLLTNPEAEWRKDPKYPKEEREECQERVWKLKAHYNEDGYVIAPSSWIRKSLLASQRQNGAPIKPAGAKKSTDTLYQSFVSGLIVQDAVITTKDVPVTADTLMPFKKMCRPSKIGGKVLVIRPMIPTPWQIDLEITITDQLIRKEHVVNSLKWAGQFNGLGDWRPANGGMFGVYEVTEI